MKCYVLNWMVW